MCSHIHTYLHFAENRLLYMCPHDTTRVSWCRYICVLIRLHVCPHTSLHFAENGLLLYACVLMLLHMSSCYYICVLILSSCWLPICLAILVLLYVSSCYVSSYLCMCPHATTCALILVAILVLLCIRPHATTCVLVLV
jgi:hypothetical protein